MKYLLDTHIFLWWLNNDKRLTESIRKIIKDPQRHIFISVVNTWEISIKQRIGKLPLKTTLAECFEKSTFDIIPIRLQHILTLDTLPFHHKDPFDRILIAQAKVEELIILTDDVKIAQYEVRVS